MMMFSNALYTPTVTRLPEQNFNIFTSFTDKLSNMHTLCGSAIPTDYSSLLSVLTAIVIYSSPYLQLPSTVYSRVEGVREVGRGPGGAQSSYASSEGHITPSQLVCSKPERDLSNKLWVT